MIDTQSIKTSTNVPLTSQGTDPGEKIVGFKRGIVTDTLGTILAVTVAAAGLSDNVIGIRLLDQTKTAYSAISTIWVDSGFRNAVMEHGARSDPGELSCPRPIADPKSPHLAGKT